MKLPQFEIRHNLVLGSVLAVLASSNAQAQVFIGGDERSVLEEPDPTSTALEREFKIGIDGIKFAIPIGEKVPRQPDERGTYDPFEQIPPNLDDFYARLNKSVKRKYFVAKDVDDRVWPIIKRAEAPAATIDTSDINTLDQLFERVTGVPVPEAE